MQLCRKRKEGSQFAKSREVCSHTRSRKKLYSYYTMQKICSADPRGEKDRLKKQRQACQITKCPLAREALLKRVREAMCQTCNKYTIEQMSGELERNAQRQKN